MSRRNLSRGLSFRIEVFVNNTPEQEEAVVIDLDSIDGVRDIPLQENGENDLLHRATTADVLEKVGVAVNEWLSYLPRDPYTVQLRREIERYEMELGCQLSILYGGGRPMTRKHFNDLLREYHMLKGQYLPMRDDPIVRRLRFDNAGRLPHRPV